MSLPDSLTSKATEPGDICVKCGRAIAYAEYGPPINDAHWYHVDTERRTCDSASSVEELIAAEDSGRFASPTN